MPVSAQTLVEAILKKILIAIAFCMTATHSFAGMACPGVDVHYVGTPDWLNNNDILDTLTSQQTWVGINSTPQPDGRKLNRIAPGSAANQAGLLTGDILLTINGSPAIDPAFFDGVAAGGSVDLTVRRNGNVLPVTLTMGRADPVHFALAGALNPDLNGCPYADLSVASPIVRDLILHNVLTEDRVFRCNDAHDALAFMGKDYEIGEAYLIRGSRRLLLTVPRFGTACIAAAALDGDRLTQDATRAFLMEAVATFFQYQEDNP